MYQKVVAYKARKATTLLGVSYVKGQLVPADVIRKLKVGPLVSRGYLMAFPDPYARKGYDGPDPMVTYVPPAALPIPSADKITGTLNVTVVGNRATFDTSFGGPAFFDFGDGAVSSQNDGHTVHDYAGPGTYATSAESATHKATKSVVIAAVGTESQSSESIPPSGSEDSLGYPETGTITDVKAWVGDDTEKAQYAYDREQEVNSPRVTLLDWLISNGASNA